MATRLLDRLLRVSIFYKVLLANSFIVVFGAVIGSAITIEHVQLYPGEPLFLSVLQLVAVGLTLSVVVNFFVLKVAFLPLGRLADTVDRVRKGDFTARARFPRVSDPRVEELAATLNEMLDTVEAYRDEVRQFASRAISAQEEERKRVARELHDETAQSLTSLLVRLRIAERAGTVEEIRAGIAEVRDLTARTLEDVRKLALELRPSALDDLGLVPALQWYTRQYARRHEIAVEFVPTEVRANPDRLPPEVELVLYRVVQEALTNIAKHASATTVRVDLARLADEVRASVEDDGRGFDVEATLNSRERGLGLFGMQERLELVGGTLTIESTQDGLRHGTRLSFRVRLPELQSRLAERLTGGMLNEQADSLSVDFGAPEAGGDSRPGGVPSGR